MVEFGQSINGTIQNVPGDSYEALPSNDEEILPIPLHRDITVEDVQN